MHKTNIKRHFSDKSLAMFGEQQVRGFMMRAFKIAAQNKQRHLVSSFDGEAVWIVTKTYKDCVTQKSYLADELPEADREVVRKGNFRRHGVCGIVLNPDGSVADATPPKVDDTIVVLTQQEKVSKIAAYLETNRSEFVNDPNDDSFWVHQRIIESIQKSFQRRGQTCEDPFAPLKEQFGGILMPLQPGGQFEMFTQNLPAIERIIFHKGDDLCVCGMQEILPWE